MLAESAKGLHRGIAALRSPCITDPSFASSNIALLSHLILMMAFTLMQQRESSRSVLLRSRTQGPSASFCINGCSSRTSRAATIRFRKARSRILPEFAPDCATEAPAASSDDKASYAPGECIEVYEAFEPKEGAELCSDYIIDKHIGSGSTADVYKLNRHGVAGTAPKASQVLKWSKNLPGTRQSFQREWMLGRRLNAAARHDPALNILLQTGPAVVSYSSSQELVFRGAVLEGLNGKSLGKRLEEDPSFCDIDFLLTSLSKVLTALDKAEDLVGFRHADLRVSNIMEHVLDPGAYEQLLQNPQTWRSKGYESAASAALDQGVLTLKLLDWGHSDIHESSSRKILLSAEQGSGTERDQYLSSRSGNSGSSLALQRLPAAKGLLEALYSAWYKDKSDAWRLFHSLAPRLDGRAWPERKRKQVMEFYELVSELQDVKLEAKFFDDMAVDPKSGSIRRLGSSESVYDPHTDEFVELSQRPGLDVTAKPKRGKWLRTMRDIILRGWSRVFSRRKTVSFKSVIKKMKKRGLFADPEEEVC